MSDWYSDFGPRRAAKDGIVAKKRSGAIGDSWWSRRFVAVLEAITASGRLGRGRSYARSGQVSALLLGPGEVRAKVQGSRAAPYQIRITITPLSGPEWTAAEDALAAQALFAAALLGGQMPHEIEGVFLGLGTPLFPTRSSDLRSTCNCPDGANPCKHIAAVYYILAEKFDEDPFAILAWRGRDRDALVTALRARRSDGEPEPEPETVEEEAPLPLDASFWTSGTTSAVIQLEAGDPLALLRELGPLASGGTDLAAALAPMFTRLSAGARAKLEE